MEPFAATPPPAPRLALAVLRASLAALLVAACTEPVGPVAAKPALGFDSTIAKPDVKATADTTTADGEDPADVPVAVTPATDVASVELPVAPTELTTGAKAALTVHVVRKAGAAGPPATKEKLVFLVDGQPLALGAAIVKSGAQPAVSVWKSATPGQFWLAGVRPGTAVVVATVDGIAAAERTVTVTAAKDPGLRISTPLGAGTTPATRTADNADTVRLTGSTLGKGGVKATLRFPAVAAAGSALDLELTPAVGALSVQATLGDVPGVDFKLLTGRLWLDQVDNGLYRGTFLGQTSSLQPVAGAFIVERDGKFGVDVLGPPVVVAASVSPEPTPGVHVSRATVSAIGNGQALVLYRRIVDVSNADLVRVGIDAKTGLLDKGLSPIVVKAPALVEPDTALPALGYATAAQSAGKLLLAWEGRDGKGASKPDQLWFRTIEPDGALGGTAATVLSTDACHGQCRPQVVRLPNSRWLVLWSAPDGKGIRGVRINGDLSFDTDPPAVPVQMAQAPVGGGRVATLDVNVGVVWQHPGIGAHFRLFVDTLKPAPGPEQPLGVPGDELPPPAIAALDSPPSFLAFWIESKQKTMKFRRIGLDGGLVGPADVALGTGVLKVVAAGGKAGQAVVAETGLNAGVHRLRILKVALASPGDPGTQLGLAIDVPVTSKYPIEPSLCYVPEADTFVLAWSGDSLSEAVHVVRFR